MSRCKPRLEASFVKEAIAARDKLYARLVLVFEIRGAD
jgi:hypothetical protein